MTPRTIDRGVALIAAGVVASVAVALAGLTWRLGGVDDGRAHVAAVGVAAPASAPLDLSPITRFAPFGQVVSVVGATGAPSALGLQLRGIMLARPQSASSALIAAANGPAKAYVVGETLPGGAILDAVEFDLVVLRVNGQLQTLAFPAKPGAPGVAAQPAQVAAPIGPQPRVDDGAPVEAYRARAADPLSLLGSLGATATPDGYRVGATPSDDMRRAGLQPGDIVEKVNGQAVGDPARDRALFDDAVVSGRVRVDVVRDGKHIAMSFPLH
jgi:general secretion pathway protein C